MRNLKEFYNKKKVFITGITGFKGSWLAYLLNELGAEVYGIGLKENNNTNFDILEVDKFALVDYLDIRELNKDSGHTALALDLIHNADIIFHLAAQPIVSKGWQDPVETFEANLLGTLYLQELIRKKKNNAVYLNITTDKVYKPSNKPHIECDVLEGEDPYSLSKSFSDMLTRLYKESIFPNNIKAITVRAGNVIGGGDWTENRIVPDIIQSIMKKEVVHLRSPESTRPYQYVLDCLMQYILVAAYGNHSEYNIGPDNATMVTTRELVEAFGASWSADGESIGKENQFLQLDISKIKEEFQFIPYANTIEDMAEKTKKWYILSYKTKEDTLDFSEKEAKGVIEHYAKYI